MKNFPGRFRSCIAVAALASVVVLPGLAMPHDGHDGRDGHDRGVSLSRRWCRVKHVFVIVLENKTSAIHLEPTHKILIYRRRWFQRALC